MPNKTHPSLEEVANLPASAIFVKKRELSLCGTKNHTGRIDPDISSGMRDFRAQVPSCASTLTVHRVGQGGGRQTLQKSLEQDPQRGRFSYTAGSPASAVLRRASLRFAGFVILLLAMVFLGKTEKLHSSEPKPTVGGTAVTPNGESEPTPRLRSTVVTLDSESPETRTVRGTVVTPDGKPVVAGNVGFGLNENHRESAKVMALDQGKFALSGIKPGGRLRMEFEVPGHSVKTLGPGTVRDDDLSLTIVAYPLQKYRIRVEEPDEPRELWVTAGDQYDDSAVQFEGGWCFLFIQEDDVLVVSNNGANQVRLNGRIEGNGSPRVEGGLKKGDTLEMLEKSGSVLHRIQCLEVAVASEPTRRASSLVVRSDSESVSTRTVTSMVSASKSESESTRTVRGKLVTPDGKPVVAGTVYLKPRGGDEPVRMMPLDQGNFTFGDVRPYGKYLVEFEVPGHSVLSQEKAWPISAYCDLSFTIVAHPLQKYRIRVEAPDEPREFWVTSGIQYDDPGVRFGDGTAFWFVQDGDLLALDTPDDAKHQMRLKGKFEGHGSPRFRGGLSKGDTLEMLDENGNVLHRIQCLEVTKTVNASVF